MNSADMKKEQYCKQMFKRMMEGRKHYQLVESLVTTERNEQVMLLEQQLKESEKQRIEVNLYCE